MGGGEGVAGISQGRFLYVCACVCGRADEVLWVRDTVTRRRASVASCAGREIGGKGGETRGGGELHQRRSEMRQLLWGCMAVSVCLV